MSLNNLQTIKHHSLTGWPTLEPPGLRIIQQCLNSDTSNMDVIILKKEGQYPMGAGEYFPGGKTVGTWS